MSDQKFNVVPCGSCGQKYAGQGYIVHHHGQATNVVCPPCYETGGVPSTHPELEESTPDPHGHWHDALTLVENHHDAQAMSDFIQTMTRQEIERTIFALTGLVHHRATMYTEIEDTQEWASIFREIYQLWIERPASDTEEE